MFSLNMAMKLSGVECQQFLSNQDLAMVVEKETRADQPVLLCSAAGYDASHYVEALPNARRYLVTEVSCDSTLSQ